MYQINLKSGFGSSLLRFRRRDRLADIVKGAEKDMRARLKESNFHDQQVSSHIVTDFCGIYASVDDHLSKLGAFANEGREQARLNKVYSLYTASVAVMNALYDDSIRRIVENQECPYQNRNLTQEDMKKSSDTGLLGNALEQLMQIPTSRNPELEKYNLYSFFDTVRVHAKNEFITNSKPQTLDHLKQISIEFDGYDFVDHVAIRKQQGLTQTNGKNTKAQADNKSRAENLEKLPDDLPSYVFTHAHAKLDHVVGNLDGLKKLYASVHQAMDYNPIDGSNPHYRRGFIDIVVVHGTQGTGKNFTVDAVLNAARKEAENLGKPFKVVGMKKQLRSIYKDRTAQLFNHFADMELDSNSVYVNVLNEADGIFGLSEEGASQHETSKLISDAKEVMDMTTGKGIVWWIITNYPGAFEGAFGDRLTDAPMYGAQSQEDYSKLIHIKLEPARIAGKYKLDDNQLRSSAAYYMQKGKELEQRYRIILSGRGVADICEKFTAFDIDTYLRNRDRIHQAPAENQVNMIESLMPDVTYDRLVNAIDRYVEGRVSRYVIDQRFRSQHRRQP